MTARNTDSGHVIAPGSGSFDPLHRDALIRIGGLDAQGLEGFHNVGDEAHHDECPGCWAWWGLFRTVRPTQTELDALRAEAHLDPAWIAEGKPS